jgi:hypothetical protein
MNKRPVQRQEFRQIGWVFVSRSRPPSSFAENFLRDSSNVEGESFMAKLEEYWKFREPEQEE